MVRALPRKVQLRVRSRLLRDMVNDIKLDRGCRACGYRSCAAALHFHHRVAETKRGWIARMISTGCYTVDRVVAEIDKCDVLCSRCHAEHHARTA